jgi:hypothetical protein
MCAIQGFPDDEIVAPLWDPPGEEGADPVDAAIHAYSVLIDELISAGRQPYAATVITFLQIDYAYYMSDTQLKQMYNSSKNEVLALLGNSYNALLACRVLNQEVLQYLLQIFRNKRRYIESSPEVKKAIARYVITYREQNMQNVYSNQMTHGVKVRFFAFILNQPQPLEFIENFLCMSATPFGRGVKDYMINRLNDHVSELRVFLDSPECGNEYPRAAQGATALVEAAAAAQAAAAQAAAAQAALVRAKNPFLQVIPKGAGGSQKRTLRKIKLKKSKKTKSKSNKHNMQKKKSHHRRHSSKI